jgi:probable HAF family extracellular repeat protein
MKTILTSIAASSLLAALAVAQPSPYTVTDLGTLNGGTFSYASVVTNSGLITGHASPPDGSLHAVLWEKGRIGDVGTPGLVRGANSEAFGVNERGQVSGEAETSMVDPNGEDFCGFKAMGIPTAGTTCVPFLWQNGVMTRLPTLGGPNGSAGTINNAGEIVGYAENTKRDPACGAPQMYQFKPVIWAKGKIQELPTFPGDLEGIALGNSDAGQVVGASGTCTAFNPNSQVYLVPSHALLWRNGKVTDLGNLGGSGTFFGNFACAVNNQGQVVGQSDLRGDSTSHAFLWQNGVMTDLGTFAGDFASLGFGINERGLVVGASVDANFNFRAVLWDQGKPVDLNTLIPGNSGLYLQLAESINARGEIIGFAQTSTGETHAFLATPRDDSGNSSENLAPAAPFAGSPVTLSESGRKLLQQRLRFGQLGAKLGGPR